MSTRNPLRLSGKSKLSASSGSAALRQLSDIHKKISVRILTLIIADITQYLPLFVLSILTIICFISIVTK